MSCTLFLDVALLEVDTLPPVSSIFCAQDSGSVSYISTNSNLAILSAIFAGTGGSPSPI